jgi:hypothetical protein
VKRPQPINSPVSDKNEGVVVTSIQETHRAVECNLERRSFQVYRRAMYPGDHFFGKAFARAEKKQRCVKTFPIDEIALEASRMLDFFRELIDAPDRFLIRFDR